MGAGMARGIFFLKTKSSKRNGFLVGSESLERFVLSSFLAKISDVKIDV